MRYIKLEEGIYKTRHSDRIIIDTDHAIDRFMDKKRFDNAGSYEFKKELIWTINNGIDKILTDYKDKKSNYLIHSKRTGIGVVIDWRQDYDRLMNDLNQAIVVSPLGKKFNGEKFYTTEPDDIYLIVENKGDITTIEVE